MARGRMVSTTIGTDKRLNGLSMESHFLFLMTVPHLDRDGLVLGDAPVLASIAIPRRPELHAQVDALIQEWIDCKVVVAFDSDDGRVLYFPGFMKNQPGMRHDREPASNLPVPPGYVRTTSGLTPDDSKTPSGNLPADFRQPSGNQPPEVEEKRREVEEKLAPATPALDWWSHWVDSFPQGQILNPVDKRNLQSVVNEVGECVVVEAIDYANKHKHTPTISLAYVEAIVDGWRSDGKLEARGNGTGKPSKPTAKGKPRKLKLPDGSVVEEGEF